MFNSRITRDSGFLFRAMRVKVIFISFLYHGVIQFLALTATEKQSDI